MNKVYKLSTFILILLLSCQPKSSESPPTGNENVPVDWQWTPFVKADSVNPVLTPSSELTFRCPLLKKEVKWEQKDVFNPAALVKNNRVYMIYRAEDTIGRYAGTSRLGLAVSNDGLHFKKHEHPVFYPDEDQMKIYEWEGGVEDPRLVEDEKGDYIMTYTAWDGTTARLAIASSDDLKTWEKHGLVIGKYQNGKYRDLWSKSGAIVCRREGDRLIAARIDGKYWMYWGDTNIYMATSENLIEWIPLENENGQLKIIFGPRKGYFDSELVEPGPPPIVGDSGILMIYNSKNHAEYGDPELPAGTYSSGQILFHPEDPTRVIARAEKNFFRPEKNYEIKGQVGNVCFPEALIPYKGSWFLYYGTADSKIATAVYHEE